jgi:hypothetical protein
MKFKNAFFEYFGIFALGTFCIYGTQRPSFSVKRAKSIVRARTAIQLIVLFYAALLPLSLQATLKRVSDFALIDTQGEFHQFSRYRHLNGIVMMAFDEGCESMRFDIEQFRELEAKFRDSDLVFFATRCSRA